MSKIAISKDLLSIERGLGGSVRRESHKNQSFFLFGLRELVTAPDHKSVTATMAAIKEFSIFPLEEDIQASRQPFTAESHGLSSSIAFQQTPSFIINKLWSTHSRSRRHFYCTVSIG